MSKYRVKVENTISEELFTFDELISNGFLDDYDESIQIKQEHESQWTIARNYPFSKTEIKPYTINSDGSITRNKIMTENSNNYSVNDDGSITRPQGYRNLPKPDSNLVWAILCTLFCCLPLGILAIIESAKVDSLYLDGNYDGAVKAANKSKSWCQWAVGLGILFVIIYVIALANSNN